MLNVLLLCDFDLVYPAQGTAQTNNEITTTGVYGHVVKKVSSSRALNEVTLAFLDLFLSRSITPVLSLLSAYTGEIKLSVSYSLNLQGKFFVLLEAGIVTKSKVEAVPA